MGDMDIFPDDEVYYVISMGFVDVALQKAADLISDPRSSVTAEMYERTGGLTPLRIFVRTLPLEITYMTLIMPGMEWDLTKENVERVKDALNTVVPGFSSDGERDNNIKKEWFKFKQIARLTGETTLILSHKDSSAKREEGTERVDFIDGVMDQSFEEAVISRSVGMLAQAKSQYLLDPELREEWDPGLSPDDVRETVKPNEKIYYRQIVEEYYPAWLRTRSVHTKEESAIAVYVNYEARAFIEA